MSQNTPVQLPTSGTYDGNAAAAYLNAIFNNLISNNSGTTAPSYAVPGTLWPDTSVTGRVSLKMYDGTNWTVFAIFNQVTGTTTEIQNLKYANFPASTNLASAATTDLSTILTPYVNITGTNSITSFGSGTNQFRFIRFAGALTLTYNGTSLVLPGGANIATAAGDTAIASSDGSGNWTVLFYQRANGTAVAASSAAVYGALNIQNGYLSISAAAGALTVSVVNLAGSTPSAGNPVTVWTRNATAANGALVQTTLTSALTLTIPSGATAGVPSGQAFRTWFGVFLNGSTPVLAVAQSLNFSTRSIAALRDGFATSTAISAGASSSGVWYTSSTVSGSAPVAILGYAEWSSSGLATAGTWTAPATIQLLTAATPLPGQVVDIVCGTSSTVTNTTSSTYVTTSLSAAIALSSAANLVRAQASGTLKNPPASQGVYASLFRGSQQIGSPAYLYPSAAASSWLTTTLFANDRPNTTASTTYAVYVATEGGGSGSFGYVPSGPGTPAASQTIEIQEIQV